MYQERNVIDNQKKFTQSLKELFKKHTNFKFINVNETQINIIIQNIPEIIIINEDNIQTDIVEICNTIRKNADNNSTPLIISSSNEDKEHKIELAKASIEYYIPKSMGEEYLYYKVKNMSRLLAVNRTVSPLTGLPGNVQIQKELKKRLLRRESFSVLYLDLDNFKAYNDVYGFLQGDEIIKFTAKTIVKNVNEKNSNDIFVGHIGGDDFVAILNITIDYERVCQNIIEEFDTGVKKFFTEEDREKGYIKIQNRKGKMEHFPLTTISIGAVFADCNKFGNILEIGETGAQMKHLAKKYKGSCYAVDRRKNRLE